MGSGIKQSNLKTGYRLIGVFATAAAYLTDLNKESAEEGDTYYDTTLDYQRSYNGSSWAPSGTSPIGPGSLDAAANIGTKITIDGAMTTGVEIEATDGMISDNGALLLLDNDDTGSDVHCLELTNAGTAAALQFTAGQAGPDIRGTAGTWSFSSAGAGVATALTFGDNNAVNFGAVPDAILQWDASRLALTAAADSVFRIGNGTYNYDVEFIGQTSTGNLMKWLHNGGAGSVGALVFDNADIDLGDADLIRFGDSQDFTLGVTAGSPNNLILLGSGEQLTIGADDEGMDVYWYTEATGDYVYFDETNALVDFIDVDLDLDDDAILRFGSSNDFTIQNIAGSPNVLRITGADEQLDFGVSGSGFDMYWYTEDATNYVYWDEDNSRMDMIDVDLRLDDDARLYFGSDADVYFDWDDTNNELDFVGNFSVTGDFTVSGAFDIGNFAFGDDEELRFGNSNDFVFHYDSSNANLEIDAAAANDEITFGLTTATDVRIDGATYDIHWDASEDTLCFEDSSVLGFGNNAATPDIEISWDATRLNITGSGEEIRIGADTAGLDIRFYSDTTGNFMLWDMDANTNGGLVLEDATITMMDDTNLLFGDGVSGVVGDFKMYSDGTDLFIQEVAAAAGLILKLGTSGKGLEVLFYGDNAGRDMTWDQDEDALTFEDSAAIKLGTGNDLVMSAAGTTVTFTLAATSTMVIADTDDVASLLTLGTSGTNGLDVLFQGATAGDYVDWDAGADTWNFGVDATGIDVNFFGETASSKMMWDQDGDTNGSLILTGASCTITGIDSTPNVLTLTGVDTTGNTDTLLIDHSGDGYAINIDLNEATSDGINIEPFTNATVPALMVDGDTAGYLGDDATGMVHLQNDIAGGHANATLLLIDKQDAGVAEVNSAEGSCLRIVENMDVSGSPPAYAMYISSVDNEALHVDSGTVVVDETVQVDAGIKFSTTTTMMTDKIEITNTQLKALNATPKELVATKGADAFIEFCGAVLVMDYGTNVLVEGAENLDIEYDGGTGPAVCTTIECTGFIDQAADQIAAVVPIVVAGTTTAASTVNKNIVLLSNEGDFSGNAGNDTTMTVFVSYKVHTVGLV